MDLQQFLRFAVEVRNDVNGFWSRGYIMDKKEDSFSVDFFVEGHMPHAYLPRSRLWLPRTSFHQQSRLYGPAWKAPVLGDEVEVLIRLSTREALTWFPAVVVVYLQSFDVLFAKLTGGNVGQIVAVEDDCVTKEAARLPVEVDRFRKETFRVPDVASVLAAEKVSFLQLWHDRIPEIKVVRKDGDIMEGVVDMTSMGIDNILSRFQGEYWQHFLLEELDRSYRRPRPNHPVFWHGQPMAHNIMLEEGAFWKTPRSMFYKRPRSSAYVERLGALTGPSPLDDVPNELLVTVFRLLDVVDQRVLRRVSSRFDSLLGTRDVRRRLMIGLTRFDGWVVEEQFAQSGCLSLQCVYTLLTALSPDVKHLVISADGGDKVSAKYPLPVQELFQVVHACVKYVRAELTTVTVADTIPVIFDLVSPHLVQGVQFPAEWSEIADYLRWENICFRVTSFGEVDAPIVPIKFWQMDLTSCVDVRSAMLDMLDSGVGIYTPTMRSSAREKILKASSAVHRFTYLGMAGGHVSRLDREDWDSEKSFMALRPVFLMFLLWRCEKGRS